MGQRSDEDLFLAFTRHRDCTALGALFRRRADELLRIAVFLAPRPTDAEDLVQATFLSAIAHAETWHAGSRVMNWLCGILTNHARMLRRAERRTPPLPGAAASENEPLLAALRSELRSTLAAAIATLPEPYRSVMTLHLHDGLDSHEISRRLLRPPATVRKQMERAIDRLRAALPLGLATALLVRVDPAQIAANAADAARFVDGAPLDAPTGDGAPPPPAPMPLSLSRRAGPLLFAAAGVIAIIVGVAETMAAAHTRVPVVAARPDARLPADGPNVASAVGTTTGPQAELLRVAAGPAAPL